MDGQTVLDALKDLIATVGFPIGVAIALLVNSATTQKKLNEQMQKLTTSVETLTKQLADVIVKITTK